MNKDELIEFLQRQIEYLQERLDEALASVNSLALSNEKLQKSNDKLQVSNDKLQISNEKLIATVYRHNDMETVALMKRIVPEFKSQHSKYEILDKTQDEQLQSGIN